MTQDEVRIELLSYEEVATMDRERTVVVIPTASIEQHGPHLPLDTDSYLCGQVAHEAADRARRAGPVLVTPILVFGSSEHHMAFPGTLTLRPAIFLAMVEDICRSLSRHGFRRQVILNGHGGNTALVAQAVQQLGFQEPVRIATINYWLLAREVADDIRESPPGGMSHACEFETSLMLHLRPETVRRDRIRREMPKPRFGAERLDMFARGPLTAHWSTDQLSESGVMGAPDLATADKGRRLFEACVSGLVVLIDELRVSAPPTHRR